MEEVIQIIKKLEKTSSTNDKIQILKDNKDNEVLKSILYYTYADNLQYGFSEKKLRELLNDWAKNGVVFKGVKWTNVFDMFEELAKSNINDELRKCVANFLCDNNSTEGEQELYIRILTKDLRCNFSAKLINRAIPKLIPEFNIQQAYPIHKYPLKKGTWFCLEDKLNGINCSDLNGIMLSRQGKELSNLGHILQQLEQLSFKGYYFNGELVRKNIDNIPNGDNFRLTTSIVNSDAKDKTMIDFIIFDLLPIEEFHQGKSKLKYKERLKLLKQLKQEALEKGLMNLDIPKIYYEGNDIDVIEEYLEIATSEDKEGLMAIKDCEWKNKRHNGILKIKKFMTADCKIIGYEEGEGRLKGTLGSFVIDYKGNSVKVGSGYSDIQREEYWSNKDIYVGRILEVKYKEESKDKNTGLVSLQFPTFVCIREEGKTVSYN